MTRALNADGEAPNPAVSSDGRLSRRRLLSTALSTGGALAVSGASASLLSACGAGSKQSAQSVTPAQVRDAHGTVRVLGWQPYDMPASHGGAVKGKWSYITSAAEIATKIRPRGTYDIFTSSAFQMEEFLATKRLAPIDTSVLTQYESVLPAFRDNPTWRGPDGKIYGIPYAYSPIYTVYLSAKVPEPRVAGDLMRPQYRNTIGLVDDSTGTIPHVARILGKQGDPARLTDEELTGVKDYLDKLRPQVRTIYASGEEPSLLERGDISLALTSYPFALVAGISGLGATLSFGSFAFVDGMSILDGVDVAAAHNWLDRSIGLTVQRQLADKSGYPPVRTDASSSLPPVLRKPPLEEMIKLSPVMTRPPLRPEPGFVTLEDWDHAWNDYKASFS